MKHIDVLSHDEAQKLVIAEKLVSMWDTEGQYESQYEAEYYLETLKDMGYNETDALEIVSEIDIDCDMHDANLYN